MRKEITLEEKKQLANEIKEKLEELNKLLFSAIDSGLNYEINAKSKLTPYCRDEITIELFEKKNYLKPIYYFERG